MVNYCVCAGWTNSSMSGHGVHSFPGRKRTSDSFCARVRFVQVKRQDFRLSSRRYDGVLDGFSKEPKTM